jgi:hypothetical protein
MNRIVSVGTDQGYMLHVLFDDGSSGEVDLSVRLFGPIFEPLRDPLLFAQVRVDEHGAVCWPNGGISLLTRFIGQFLRTRSQAYSRGKAFPKKNVLPDYSVSERLGGAPGASV